MINIIPPAASRWYDGYQLGTAKKESQEPMERITANSLVQDVVKDCPQTISVFARRGLQCVGCYISPFHTIADVSREYALALDPLLDELNQVFHKPMAGSPLKVDA